MFRRAFSYPQVGLVKLEKSLWVCLLRMVLEFALDWVVRYLERFILRTDGDSLLSDPRQKHFYQHILWLKSWFTGLPLRSSLRSETQSSGVYILIIFRGVCDLTGILYIHGSVKNSGADNRIYNHFESHFECFVFWFGIFRFLSYLSKWLRLDFHLVSNSLEA